MKVPNFNQGVEPEIITADIGGTNMRLATFQDMENRHIEDTPQYKKAIGALATGILEISGGKKPDIISISIAGKVEDGKIADAGKLRENGWVGEPFVDQLADKLSIETDRIVLLNDCVAGAAAERAAYTPSEEQLGSYATGAFLTLSTGFGGALWTPDNLIPDEPGHEFLRSDAICGCEKKGCIEAYIGGSGIEKDSGQPGENISHYDPRWRRIKKDFHNAMDQTLHRYQERLGIEPQILGFTGSVALGGPSMLEDLQSHLTESYPKVAVKEARYGEDSGLYGAAFAARALANQF